MSGRRGSPASDSSAGLDRPEAPVETGPVRTSPSLRRGPGKGHVVLLVAILAVTTAASTLLAIVILYSASLNQTRSRLREYVQSQARLIEQIAAHEEGGGDLLPASTGRGASRQAVLKQLAGAHALYGRASRTGEFKIAERIGDSVHYLLSHRGPGAGLPKARAWDRAISTPMQHALSGLSGTMVGLDYRGARVVAAYEPVQVYGWGAVAKIDLDEVRAPFVQAGLLAGLVALVLLLFGSFLFFRATDPVLRRLADSENRYRFLFNEAPAAIATATYEGEIVDANRLLGTLLGYSSDELSRLNVATLYADPGGREAVLAALRRDGKVVDREVPLKHKGGSIITCLMNAWPAEREGRQVVLTTLLDITKRRRAEELRHESESRFHELFDSIGTCVAIYEGREDGQTFVIKDFNPAAEQTEKVKRKDIIGRSVAEVFPGVKELGLFDVFQRVWKTGKPEHHPISLYRDDRIAGWRENYVYKLPTGEIVAVYEDVTERKRAEERMRFFSTVFEHTSEGVYLIRAADGTIVQTNARFDAMFGYVPGELVGRNVSVVNAPDSESPGETAAKIIAELNRSGTWRGEVRNVKKDGTPFWCEAVVSTYKHPDFGEVWLSVHRDISERKEAEAEEERLNRELAAKAAELEQLIYAASHDLRAPLVTVRGFAGELRKSLEDLAAELKLTESAPKERERLAAVIEQDIPQELKYIEAGAARMDALLAGLLKLSRLGRTTVKIEVVDMGAIVDSVLRSFEFAVREAGAIIDVSDLPRCMGDPTLVSQVVANLVDNAIKYRSPDRPLVLTVSGKLDGKRAVYCVEDNGLGVDGDCVRHVFEPFYQVEPKQGTGEGLGLTIVGKNLARMRGRAWVESEPGRGSRFYIELPAAGKR
ncbi:PAS domain S-box protein [candidate division WOR-3 bacterium]|uniref:histidine kinase n=1 Tax=candidate division WOR-3 bacterium TaxID=2052148 RepID=A0A937XEJ9_UNCW3|nr:PAS domain S-box protein [candidate division WOR-3 bacterium]